MTQEEIIEGNKFIADFMGAKFINYTTDFEDKTKEFTAGAQAMIFEYCGAWWRCSFTPDDNFSWYFPKDLKFHSSWEWIMPVVEKIESMSYSVEITSRYCTILKNVVGPTEKRLKHSRCGTTKIEATWLAVVEFIKWYNKQK